MSLAFGDAYADVYDLLYQDKDYAAECDLIEQVFRTCGELPVRNILDLGCGTANHAVLLAERGYAVVGVDRSEGMLAHAARKAAANAGKGSLVVQRGDIRALHLGRAFDAAIMMFTVLGYQVEDVDVIAALASARRHLHHGGLLLFDVWHGPAVLHQRPSHRVKVVRITDGHIVRSVSAELDVERHVCTIHIDLKRFTGETLVAETEERHRLRYFFPHEVDGFLRSARLVPVRLGGFPAFDREPDETTWNVLAVARAA